MRLTPADWAELSRRAGKASHRLIGWIYWDPVAVEAYGALGVPDALGYYIASRAAPLATAGPDWMPAGRDRPPAATPLG